MYHLCMLSQGFDIQREPVALLAFAVSFIHDAGDWRQVVRRRNEPSTARLVTSSPCVLGHFALIY